MPTTQELLDEAIAARHKLRTGKLVAEIRHGDANGGSRVVVYTQANSGDLDRYISELQGQLTAPAGRRPFGVIW